MAQLLSDHKTFRYIFSCLILFTILKYSIVSAKPCQGVDLPVVSPARVGILSKVACGAQDRTTNDQYLTVRYSTKLYRTCESVDANRTETVILGGRRSNVPKAWSSGLARMCVGDKRRITAPHEDRFHRGSVVSPMHGRGAVIPPNVTVTWDVELMRTKDVDNGPPNDFLQKIFQSSEHGTIVPAGSPQESRTRLRDTLEMAQDAAKANPAWLEENERMIEELKDEYNREYGDIHCKS